MDYRSNHNVVFSCKYHVVWCPKYRRNVLVGDVEIRLKQILIDVVAAHKCQLTLMEIMPDHVRMLVDADPQFGIHRLVKAMKGWSSRLLRQEFQSLRTRLPTLWTNSYFVATVGGAPLEIIKQYVANQKKV